MTLGEFEDLLESHGGDLASWPQARRAAALALVEGSEVARRALDTMRDVETVLRAAQPVELPSVDRVVARAIRHQQLTPRRARVARFGWAGVAAAALVFGILVGDVWPDREISPDRLMAASFATQGVVDVD